MVGSVSNLITFLFVSFAGLSQVSLPMPRERTANIDFILYSVIIQIQPNANRAWTVCRCERRRPTQSNARIYVDMCICYYKWSVLYNREKETNIIINKASNGNGMGNESVWQRATATIQQQPWGCHFPSILFSKWNVSHICVWTFRPHG